MLSLNEMSRKYRCQNKTVVLSGDMPISSELDSYRVRLLSKNDELKFKDTLNRVSTITFLNTQGSRHITEVTMEALSNYRHMKYLYLEGVKAADIEPLRALVELEGLRLMSSDILESIEPISGLGKLRSLLLGSLKKVRTISALEGELCNSLERLSLFGGERSVVKIDSLDSLPSFNRLKYVDIHNFRFENGGLLPLLTLDSLSNLYLSKPSAFARSEIDELIRKGIEVQDFKGNIL